MSNFEKVWWAIHQTHDHREDGGYRSIDARLTDESCEACEGIARTAIEALGVAGLDGSIRVLNDVQEWATKDIATLEDTKLMAPKLRAIYDSFKIMHLHSDPRMKVLEAKIATMGIANNLTGWTPRGLAYELLLALETPSPSPAPEPEPEEEDEDYRDFEVDEDYEELDVILMQTNCTSSDCCGHGHRGEQ